ncbi:MAG TPA: hypothetical protein VEU51_03060 [Candidatus Acidoferrales bacterium]|nr:hypothetical protein [Candidatus Acidoferrales bacterium]
MPTVEPVASATVGPIVILGDPIDARSYSAIEQVTDPCGRDVWDTMFFPRRVCLEAFVPPGVRSPQPNAPGVRFTVGPEIAQHANALLENQLVRRGFRVVHIGTAADAPASRRVVVVTVVSAYQGNDWPVGWTASATLAVAVQDQSGERIFSQTYTGTRSYGLDVGVMFELLAERQAELSKAFDDAIAKACDDPAFIAAITPSSGRMLEAKSKGK